MATNKTSTNGSGTGATRFRITEPALIPAGRYYDQEFFELEREKLWPHVWQMACRLEEIPTVGDWVEYTNLEKSVVVVRTKNGVKAFHNVCRHRGVKLASGRGNCGSRGFVCPFHGWRYNEEGACTFVFARQLFEQEILAQEQIGLAPCRLEEWAGCAFINYDDQAPPLRECLGPVAERIEARNADKLKMEWWYGTVLPTNWKLAMEAFMEGYHTMRTHPQLFALMVPETHVFGLDMHQRPPERQTTVPEFVDRTLKLFKRNSEGMAGMILENEVVIAESLRDMLLPDDLFQAAGVFTTKLKEEIYRQGMARGLPIFDIGRVDQTTPSKLVEFIFPHFFLLPFYSAMSSYRIRPLTPETCFFEIWSLALMPEDQPHERVTKPTILPYDSRAFPEIPRQDYSNLPNQQLGVHCGGFDYMRLSHKTEGMISNYQRLIDGFIEGRDLKTLAKASQIVNSGYDAPIADIGL